MVNHNIRNHSIKILKKKGSEYKVYIKLTEEEVIEALELYLMKKLKLEYHPTGLNCHFLDRDNDQLFPKYVEMNLLL